MGERVNFYGSLVCLTGCLLFVAVYTVMPFLTHRQRWWNSRIGRLLVTKALAIAGLMLIVIVLYLFRPSMEWIRTVRGVFSAVVGVMMMYQAALVVRIQRQKEDGSA